MKLNKAFTLIEIVVVLALLAILGLLVIGGVTTARRMAAESHHLANLKTAETSIQKLYKNNAYPCTSAYGAYCDNVLGDPTIMNTLKLDSTSLNDTGCTTYIGEVPVPTYGVRVVGKGSPAFGSWEGRAGVTGQGKSIILVQYDWSCAGAVGYLAL